MFPLLGKPQHLRIIRKKHQNRAQSSCRTRSSTPRHQDHFRAQSSRRAQHSTPKPRQRRRAQEKKEPISIEFFFFSIRFASDWGLVFFLRWVGFVPQNLGYPDRFIDCSPGSSLLEILGRIARLVGVQLAKHLSLIKHLPLSCLHCSLDEGNSTAEAVAVRMPKSARTLEHHRGSVSIRESVRSRNRETPGSSVSSVEQTTAELGENQTKTVNAMLAKRCCGARWCKGRYLRVDGETRDGLGTILIRCACGSTTERGLWTRRQKSNWGRRVLISTTVGNQ